MKYHYKNPFRRSRVTHLSSPAPQKTSSSNHLLLLLLVKCIILTTHITPSLAAGECPSRCRCPPEHNNTEVDCSDSQLTAPPQTGPDTKTLLLGNNALGPIINDTFPRMSSLTHLDLSYNGLTRLLGCTLQGMLGLRRVSLRGNRLTSLPDSLFTDATDLEHLDISHNIMAAIPDHVFRNVPNLVSVDASHNRMVRLEFGLALQVPRHLRSIDLSHNLFESITSDAFHSARGWQPGVKRKLNLANCRLTSIQSPALNKIPELNDLVLSGNARIPTDNLTVAIKELESSGLEKLSLSGLNLTTLQPFFTQVTTMSLKSLDVSNNLIENVPDNTFSTISSLRSLDISGNKLTSLDEGLSDLRNLRKLNISFNSLTSFKGDAIVANIDKLKILDLSHNELANPSDVNIGPLEGLTKLIASENHLTSVVLPDSTNSLKHFDFRSNAITEFSGFDHAPKLNFFDISDNDLQEVADYLFKQALYLKVVNFSRNSITKLHTNAFMPKSALVVDLSHNFIEKIKYSNWLATQELYLNDNDIQDLDFESFHLMTGLTILDLSNNKLPGLHDDLLDYASSLVYLNLSQNSIQQTDFPLLFRNLENLEVLDMSGNNVSDLHKSMLVPIPKLKRLLLARNHLEIVRPLVFRDLKHIENIDLSGNPFLCNCDNLGFQDWISRTQIDITGLYALNSSAYVCSGPGHRLGEHITEWSPDKFECDKTMLYMIVCGAVGLTLIVAGVVSTIIYRVYKCHKRRKLEKEKERFRKNVYGIGYDDDDNDDDDDVDGYPKRGGKLDLSKMTTDEIAEEITNAIERRERRSMRRAEEMKRKNANGYVPWPPNGNAKSAKDEKKDVGDKAIANGNSKGRRESIEARQFDRVMQQPKDDAKQRNSPDNGGKKANGPESKERRSSRPEIDDPTTHSSKALKVHRSSPLITTDDIIRLAQQQQQHQQRWRQSSGRVGSGYVTEQLEPEPDYGYETEPGPRGSGNGGGREGKRYNRWDSLDVWDRDRRGWQIQGQGRGQGQPQRRSRSQGPVVRDGYMTLPMDYPSRTRSSRRGQPKLYLDPYTNEVRFGAEDLPRRQSGDRKHHQPHYPPRQSRWDAYQNQNEQQHKMRARSFHQLPQEYDNGRPGVRYVDSDDDNYRRYQQQQHQQQQQQQQQNHRHQRSNVDDDRRPLIGPQRAVSQPYLVNENTSDWL